MPRSTTRNTKKPATGVSPALPGSLRQAPLTAVKFLPGFWHKRQSVNRKAAIPHQFEVCETTGRNEAWRLACNPAAARAKASDPAAVGGYVPPHIFWDSDVAKWIEAAAFSLATSPDKKVEAQIDALVDLMGKAQLPDGYLNTHYIVTGIEKRWSNVQDNHELYCAGHLMEAAVAYFDATGKRAMLEIVSRYADHIGRTFGTGPGQIPGYCGHEEIELALIKLSRATENRKYLELANYFVMQRGTRPHFFDSEHERNWGGKAPADNPPGTRYQYAQAHLPVLEQTKVVGHAVRAMYLYCAMADLARELKHTGLQEAGVRLWDDLTSTQLYITGGIGQTRKNEGFTEDFDLPNQTAYCETCASVGLALWSHRLNEMTPDNKYADLFECCIYNGALSGMSLDGRKFFYENPLESRGNHHRQATFTCACCLSNISRLIASMNQFMYSTAETDEGTVFVHQYAANEADLKAGKSNIHIKQETGYPWDGAVQLTLNGFSPKTRFTLALRIPGWCKDATLAINGKRVALSAISQRGYAYVDRTWTPGDVVTLTLAMPVERVRANPKVSADIGRVALKRGPVVYCLEEADNGGGLHGVVLPQATKFKAAYSKTTLDGVTVLSATAVKGDLSNWDGKSLYCTQAIKRKRTKITAVPYFAWDNRKPGEMLVWVRED
jgi:uncharacterized protein